MTQKHLWTLLFPQTPLPETLTLTGPEHHYALHVLRLEPGDKVSVTNGLGDKALAKLCEVNKKQIKLLLLEKTTYSQHPPFLHIWLGMPKPSTLEDMVSLVSEMGVYALHRFKSHKTPSLAHLKQEKLERLSQESLRISQGAFASKLFFYPSLEDLIHKQTQTLQTQTLQTQNLHSQALHSQNLFLLCDEREYPKPTLTGALLKLKPLDYQDIHLIIGPEASFSSTEYSSLSTLKGLTSASLGTSVLRVPHAVCSAYGILSNTVNYLKDLALQPS
jgi:16S rRNA (uracil1498-N3)-methyltransferase